MEFWNWKWKFWIENLGFEYLEFEIESFILNPLQKISWKLIRPFSSSWFFLRRKEKKKKKKKKKNFFFWELTQQLSYFKCEELNFGLHFSCLFLFFFLFCFLLPPPFFHRCYYSPSSSTWFFFFTPPFPLSKITFLNFSTFLYSSPSIFFQILVFGHLCYTPILWNPFPNFHFLCTTMPSSSNGPSFLTFHGKKYHPSLEWNDEEGLLQDPKIHAPHSHMDFKVSFFWEIFFVHASLRVWYWDIVILLLCALFEIWGIVWLIML